MWAQPGPSRDIMVLENKLYQSPLKWQGWLIKLLSEKNTIHKWRDVGLTDPVLTRVRTSSAAKCTLLLVSSDCSSLTMPAFSDGRPVTCHVDHVSSIQHTISKQMVELQAGAINGPVVTSLRVVEMVAFRRQHRQMLNVSP